MAVKAKGQITVSSVTDVKATYRYYLLQSSTLSKPSKPTTYPPTSSWGDTEPSYTSGSTNSLYFVDCTVFSDDTFVYSEVSLSSSYEAAKAAYNKAVNAQNTANEVSDALDIVTDVIVGTQTATTGSWKGVAKFASLKDGQQIVYWLPYAGSGNATLNLTLSDGSTTGAVACYYGGTSRLTTHYPAGSTIRLTYRQNVSIAGSSTTYTGWWADANYNADTYDRTKYNKAIKAGASGVTAANIIVGANGVYNNLKLGSTFDVTYPILYASSTIAASGTGTNNYLCMSFTVTTTQSISLTAYKPVYIKGTLIGTMFTPVSGSPLTQTIPTSGDGYYYILLGQAITSTTMYLLHEHPIFTYFNGSFKSVEQIAVEAAKTATNYMSFEENTGLVIGDMTASTLGNNILIDSDSIDIRYAGTILGRYTADTIYLGLNSRNATIDLCNGVSLISNLGGEEYDRLRIYSEGEITIDADRSVVLKNVRKDFYEGGDLVTSIIEMYNTRPWESNSGDDSANGYIYMRSILADEIDGYGAYGYCTELTMAGDSLKISSRGKYSITVDIINGGPDDYGALEIDCGDTGNFLASANYATISASVINLNASNYINLNSNVTIQQDKAIYGHDSNGNLVNLFDLTMSNQLMLGYGLQSNTSTTTLVYGGYSVRLVLPTNNIWFRTYDTTDYDSAFFPYNDGKCVLGFSGRRWHRIYATNTTVSASDRRQKENIIPLGEVVTTKAVTYNAGSSSTYSLRQTTQTQEVEVDLHSELFDKLQPVQYNFIEGNSRICYGFVAQDVISTMNELGIQEDELDLVHHDVWTDEETGEEKDSYGIAYENLIALLVHEVQKLKNEIADLKAV